MASHRPGRHGQQGVGGLQVTLLHEAAPAIQRRRVRTRVRLRLRTKVRLRFRLRLSGQGQA